MLKRVSSWLNANPTGLALVVFTAWMFMGLLGRDPWKPDEGYTLGLVNHVLTTGDWVVPTLAGEPFMEKPPAYFLTAAFMVKAFSWLLPVHDAARLASAFFIITTAWALAKTIRMLLPQQPFWVGLCCLIGAPGLLTHAHYLLTDNALLAGFSVALYGLVSTQSNARRGGFILGTGVGLTFLSKGLLGPGVFGLTALALPVLFTQWRQFNYLRALSWAALAVLPWLLIWPLALYQRSPALLTLWLWDNNFGRFLGTSHLGPSASSLGIFEFVPWFCASLLPFALVGLIKKFRDIFRQPVLQAAWVLAVITTLVLNASSDSRALYVLPLLAPLVVLAAHGLSVTGRFLSGVWKALSVLVFAAAIVFVWLAWLALSFGWPEALAQRLHAYQPGFLPHDSWMPVLAATAATLLWLWVVTGFRHRDQAMMAWAAGATAAWSLLCILLLPWINQGMSYKAVSAELGRVLPSRYHCVESRTLGESQRAVFEYYLSLRTQRQENTSASRECELLLIQQKEEPSESDAPGMRLLWNGSRLGDHKERFWLYQRTKRLE